MLEYEGLYNRAQRSYHGTILHYMIYRIGPVVRLFRFVLPYFRYEASSVQKDIIVLEIWICHTDIREITFF